MDIKTVVPFPRKRRSPRMSPEIASRVKAFLDLGLSQQDIATMCGVNQGRVSEINTGKRFQDVRPAQLEFVFE